MYTNNLQQTIHVVKAVITYIDGLEYPEHVHAKPRYVCFGKQKMKLEQLYSFISNKLYRSTIVLFDTIMHA